MQEKKGQRTVQDIRELYEQIKRGEDVRAGLIALKAALKDKDEKEEALRQIKGLFQEEPETLLKMVQDSDAKVRKNAALILGTIGTKECRDVLLGAYEKEEQRFVKSAYLTGLLGCDCTDCLPMLKKKREELLRAGTTAETEKHSREELEALNTLLSACEPAKKRRFRGENFPADVILTTWKEYRETAARQITEGEVSLLGSGIRIRGGSLKEILKVRTYRELLFCLDRDHLDASQAAEELASSNLLALLERYYQGGAPWRFRIEQRSRMTPQEKAVYTKKLADGLMRMTGGRLINDVSDYEAEIRLVEKKSGGYLPLLKLSALPDHRFAYRKNSVAASMQPSLAALLAELASPYMKEGARVLDPFCGVGTLLLERTYRVHADTLYGVDRYGSAIEGARENAGIAGVPAHFINKEIQSFSHEHLFDEIFTDMPSQGGKRTAHETEYLYRVLFEQGQRLLRPGSMIFLYSHDRGFALKWLRQTAGMKLVREWRISEKEDTWFLAVRYEGEKNA